MDSLINRRVTTWKRLIATLMVIAIMATLTGCDGATSTKVVSAEACFSKRKIEIPLKTNQYFGMQDAFSNFASRKTLEQIQERVLEWDPKATVEIWGEQSLFISSDNPDTGKKDYYILYRVDGTTDKFSEKKYCLDCYSGKNFFPLPDSDPYAVFIEPFHLMKYIESEPPHEYVNIYNFDHELHPEATIDDVYNFYHDSGYYDVEKKDNNTVIVNDLLYEWSEEESEITYGDHFPIIIEVFDKDEKPYIRINCDFGGDE